jgi:hypothetical protein
VATYPRVIVEQKSYDLMLMIREKKLCILFESCDGFFFVASMVVKCSFVNLFLGVITDAKENFVGGKHRADRRI